MHLSIITESDTYPVEVSEDLELENFKVLCEAEAGITASDVVIIFNTTLLKDNQKTLKDYGVKDGDLLMIMSSVSFMQRANQQIAQRSQGAAAGRASRPNDVNQFDFGSIVVPGGRRRSGGEMMGSDTRSASGQLRSPPNQSDSSAAMEGVEADGQEQLGLGEEAGNQNDPGVIRDMLLANPDQLAILKLNNSRLAEALTSGNLESFASILKEQQEARRERERQRIKLLTADPFDMEAQKLIATEIQQENINANMEAAMEFNPESFGVVHMLYIDCRVNGHAVKAFIDSGAQTTIMSQACAERCNIMRLIDTRWAGIAKGIGTQKIIGRVHMGQIQIEGDFLASSFCILAEQPMDMLLGLDMLKRHQMCIDLKANNLIIGTTGTSTPFLAETDLPDCARLTSKTEEDVKKQSEKAAMLSEEQQMANALEESARDRLQAGPSTASTSAGSNISDPDTEELVQMGFSRDDVVAELRKQNGNKTKALAALFAKSFQPK